MAVPVVNVCVLTFEVLDQIAAVNTDLGLTIKEGVKGSVTIGSGAGAGAMVGAMVGGIPGMIVGGGIGYVFGAGVAYKKAQTFKPLSEVLRNLTQQEKTRLVQVGQNLLQTQTVDVVSTIVGDYRSNLAKQFISLVYKQYSGKDLSVLQ